MTALDDTDINCKDSALNSSQREWNLVLEAKDKNTFIRIISPKNLDEES